MAFKFFEGEEPASSHYRLTVGEMIKCAKLQRQGWSIGDIAEHFEITIAEAEQQLGIRHDREGRASYSGLWRSRADLNRLDLLSRAAKCIA